MFRKTGALAQAGTLALIGLTALAGAAQAGSQASNKGLLSSEVKPYRVVDLSTLPEMPASQVHGSMSKMFRPTMGDAAYKAAKQSAMARAQAGKTGPLVTQPKSTSILLNFDGLNKNQSTDSGFVFDPPDVNSAVSTAWILETTNDAVLIQNRFNGNNLHIYPASQFLGYTGNYLSDPQVKYDRDFQRFVISWIGIPESSTVGYLFLAVQRYPSAPQGPYFIYRFNYAGGTFGSNFDLFDYPHLGMSLDGIMITANIFNNSSGGYAYTGTDLLCFSKTKLYNGEGITFRYFTGLNGTLTPPMVLDYNATAYPIYSQPGTSNVGLYAVTNISDPYHTSISGPYNVPVGYTYNVPRSAKQPGTSATLDTLDTRFQNSPWQNGSDLYAAHCADPGSGFPEVVAYDINTSNATLVAKSFHFQSGSSDDWNPEIAYNDFSGDLGLEWSSTNAPGGVNAQVIAETATSFVSLPTAGSTVYTSGSSYQNFRWGDYSSMQPDPISSNSFWGSNEYIIDSNNWGTRNFRVAAF